MREMDGKKTSVTTNNNQSKRARPTDAPKPQLTFDLTQKVIQVNKILKTEQLMNSIQLINLINFYYDRSHCQGAGSKQTKASLSPVTDEPCSDSETEDPDLVTLLYPCIACSELFEYQSTFQFHLNRPTCIIRVFCTKCNIFKTFHNKCKLLYHVYSHKMSLFDTLYKSLSIDQISIEKLTRLNAKEKKISDIAESDQVLINLNRLVAETERIERQLEDENLDVDTLKSINDTLNKDLVSCKYDLKERELLGIDMFLRQLVFNKFLIYKCYICGAVFFDLKDIKQHYINSKRIDLIQSTVSPLPVYSKPPPLLSANGQPTTNPPVNSSTMPVVQPLQQRSIFRLLKQRYTASFRGVSAIFEPDQSQLDAKFRQIINNFTIKKLQFSTKCSILASLNLINTKFQFYSNQNEEFKPNEPVLVCPECGLTFDSTTQVDTFRIHLLHDCQFTIKYECTQIRCPSRECQCLSETLYDAVSHWNNVHLVRQYECDFCEKIGVKHVFKEPIGSKLNKPRMDQISSPNDEDPTINITNENNNNEGNFSSEIVAEMVSHYNANHNGSQINVKVVYKCPCKIDEDSICEFTQIDQYRQHIFKLINQYANSINCLICNKLISNDYYDVHLRSEHSIEKICVCPECGYLKNDTNLNQHLIRVHNQNTNQRSSFFNLLNQIDPKLSNINIDKNLSELIQALPKDFYLYHCWSCRLNFTSTDSFLHNCQANNSNDSNNQNTNYFSPIFIKYSLGRYLPVVKLQMPLLKSANKQGLKRAQSSETKENTLTRGPDETSDSTASKQIRMESQ